MHTVMGAHDDLQVSKQTNGPLMSERSPHVKPSFCCHGNTGPLKEPVDLNLKVSLG